MPFSTSAPGANTAPRWPPPALVDGAPRLEVDAAPLQRATATPLSRPSAFFLAGAAGSLIAATSTAPLDVLRTRLQSDYYRAYLGAARAAAGRANPAALPLLRAGAQHVGETLHILRAIPRLERGGGRALFRGLGPTLVAVVPARGVHFLAYGSAKEFYARRLGGEGPGVHLLAAATAVMATAAAANPVWVVKTRLQLDRAEGGGARRYSGAVDCFRQTARQEGLRGLYRGLSASVLGIGETAMQWVLYEEAKRRLAARSRRMEEWGVPKSRLEEAVAPFGDAIAGGGAKFVAALSTYPHEVVRTRLRQFPIDGKRKYTGLAQCFRTIVKEEGMAGLYGGLTAHMLRVVPNAAIMFGTYEAVIRLLGER